MAIKDLPNEVLQAMVVLYNNYPVGKDMYDKINATIEKYPEHFPWETKYNSIPKEVHEAFRDECYPPIERVFIPSNDTRGIRDRVKDRGTIFFKTLTNEELIDAFNKLNEEQQTAEKQRLEEIQRVEKIWNKHYSKYKLKYREKLTKIPKL